MPLVVHHDGHEPAFDHLHEDHLHDTGNGTDSSPLELSDGGSGPRTPPALGRTHAQLVSMLPADPRQAIWPYPSSAKNSTSNPQAALLPKKLKKQTLHSHTPTPASGAPPTISTFSASNLNHIHIVQPYVHAQQNNDSGSASDDSTTNKASNKHPLNLCTTSTFSVHPTPAITSGQLSFANPYCTNALHTFMPANGAAGAGGPGGGGPSATGASGQPPRPANAWILYRSDKMKDIAPSLPGQPRPPQADISKLIAAMWKNETSEIRQHYEALSDMKKAEHLALYPGYRFQPMKKADREKVRAEKRAEKEREKMAAIALKNYARKPKAKRGATEDSVGDVTSPTIPQPMAALPWQVQVTGQAAASSPTATVTSPTSSRGHAFSYQPYAAPSAPSSAAAPVKRKRAKTKVEIETPAIPPEESQQSEYIADVPSQYYDPGAMEYLSYHHPATHYDNNTPQHSSTAASTDPNSLHTPPFDTVDPSHHQHQHHHPDASAVPITLEPVSGQQEIFQLNNFDLSNLGTSFDITLPDNFSLDMSGIGDGMVFEGFEGFGDFVNLDSFGSAASGPGLLDGIEGLEGLGVNMGMGDSNSLNLQPGYPNSFGSADASGPTPSTGNHHPQGLTISTQALHSHSHNHSYSMSESVTSPVVETPLSAASHFGSFQIQHHQQQHVYGAQFPSQGQFMSPQGFQSLLSPTQSHFASPPPMSVIDESGTPGNDAYAPPGGRRVAAKWR